MDLGGDSYIYTVVDHASYKIYYRQIWDTLSRDRKIEKLKTTTNNTY